MADIDAMLAQILPFVGGGECPVQYFLSIDDREFYIRYRHGWLSLDVDDEQVFEKRVGGTLDGFWSDEETTVYLWEISRAIAIEAVHELDVPTLYETQSHPLFEKGPFPLHAVGIGCGRRVAPDAAALGRGNRHDRVRRDHDHTNDCVIYVPANRVDTWIKLHEAEHEALRAEIPAMWNAYLRSQQSIIRVNSERVWPKIGVTTPTRNETQE